MKRNYQVTVDKQTGIPFAHVAHDDTWDLVEFLSYQRTVVFYTHYEDHLLVRFPRSNATSAQQLLDDWVKANCCEYESTSRWNELRELHTPVG